MSHYKAVCPCGNGFVRKQDGDYYDDDWGREHYRSNQEIIDCPECKTKYHFAQGPYYIVVGGEPLLLDKILLPNGVDFKKQHNSRPVFSFDEKIVQKYTKTDIQEIISDTSGKKPGSCKRSTNDFSKQISIGFVADWSCGYGHRDQKAVRYIREYLLKLLERWDDVFENCKNTKQKMDEWDEKKAAIDSFNESVYTKVYRLNYVDDEELNELDRAKKDQYASFEAIVSYDPSYKVNFVGRNFDTWYIKECVEDPYLALDRVATRITVLKKYKCECSLCQAERIIVSNMFSIEIDDDNSYFIPEQLKCDCHTSSSFECKVMDTLHKLGVKYAREVSFEGLVGDNGYPLRFDFEIYRSKGDKSERAFILELNGPQHYEPGYYEYYGSYVFIKDNSPKGIAEYEQRKRYDERKRLFCDNNNIRYECIKYTKSDPVKLEEELIKLLDKHEVTHVECF